MDIIYKTIKGYNCPTKKLLIIDGTPVAFADSTVRVLDMISYVTGLKDESTLNDKSIVGILKPYRAKYTNNKRRSKHEK